MAKIFGDPLTFGGAGKTFPNGTEWTQSITSYEYFRNTYNADGVWIAASYGSGLYYSVTWEQS